jgi:ribosomal protein S18 acetylase RimI-like enzyme
MSHTRLKKIKLYQMRNLNFDEKFNIFYKFRFHPDYLKNNTNKNKILKKESKIWFKKNLKKKKLFAIKTTNKIIGLIIYNLDNHFYSITILKKYRNQGIGTFALLKFIEILKKKKLPLVTMVKKNNKNSIHLHKKISKSFKLNDKMFYFFKII